MNYAHDLMNKPNKRCGPLASSKSSKSCIFGDSELLQKQ